MQAAIDRLLELGDPSLREAILARWAKIHAKDPVKADGGAGVRTALLRGLRRVALPGDVEVFKSAVLTIELMPLRGDVAQELRATALLGIAEVDERRAVWYAANLLADQVHVSRMSGEPARTAGRLLLTLDRADLVYLAVLRGLAHPEVRAECLRELAELPRPLLLQLAGPILNGSDEAALLGLIDLVLPRPDLGELLPDLRGWMRDTPLLDVYRYFVTAAAASRRGEVVELLRQERPLTADPQKIASLDGALELLSP